MKRMVACAVVSLVVGLLVPASAQETGNLDITVEVAGVAQSHLSSVMDAFGRYSVGFEASELNAACRAADPTPGACDLFDERLVLDRQWRVIEALLRQRGIRGADH